MRRPTSDWHRHDSGEARTARARHRTPRTTVFVVARERRPTGCATTGSGERPRADRGASANAPHAETRAARSGSAGGGAAPRGGPGARTTWRPGGTSAHATRNAPRLRSGKACRTDDRVRGPAPRSHTRPRSSTPTERSRRGRAVCRAAARRTGRGGRLPGSGECARQPTPSCGRAPAASPGPTRRFRRPRGPDQKPPRGRGARPTQKARPTPRTTSTGRTEPGAPWPPAHRATRTPIRARRQPGAATRRRAAASAATRPPARGVASPGRNASAAWRSPGAPRTRRGQPRAAQASTRRPRCGAENPDRSTAPYPLALRFGARQPPEATPPTETTEKRKEPHSKATQAARTPGPPRRPRTFPLHASGLPAAPYPSARRSPPSTATPGKP